MAASSRVPAVTDQDRSEPVSVEAAAGFAVNDTAGVTPWATCTVVGDRPATVSVWSPGWAACSTPLVSDNATPFNVAEALPLHAKPRKDAVGEAASPAALVGRIVRGAATSAATAGALGAALLAPMDLSVEVPLLRDTTAAFNPATSRPMKPGMESV